MRTLALVSLALATALVAPGCSTAIKEGAGLALGAKGTYLSTRPLAAAQESRPLGAYRRFELGTITDDIGGKAPAALLGHLPEAFAEQIRSKKLPNDPTGKTLVLRGRIIHYESSDMLGIATGPLEEVIVRAEMVDKETGAVLAEANCICRTTARVNVGVKSKAQGLAKAIVGWIDNRYPKDQRVD